MDGVLEVHDEIRRLSDRFYVAVLLDIYTRYCRRRYDGLDISDSSKQTETKAGHVAVYWAMEFNMLAHLCFVTVMIGIVRAPVVVQRMARMQPDVDLRLALGVICLSISLSFLAYLRWFVVVG